MASEEATNGSSSPPAMSNPANPAKAANIYEFAARDIDGKEISLDKYKGKVVLVVNVASNCGLTPTNYKELNDLHAKYGEKGLAIVGFPCNQFMGQEPACEVDIKEFAKKKGVEWDLMSKIDVNGKAAHPLYAFLKAKLTSGFLLMGTSFVKWNFTKFLVNREGVPIKRYEPTKAPTAFEGDIEKVLEGKSL